MEPDDKEPEYVLNADQWEELQRLLAKNTPDDYPGLYELMNPPTISDIDANEYRRRIDQVIAELEAEGVQDPDPETQARLDHMFRQPDED